MGNCLQKVSVMYLVSFAHYPKCAVWKRLLYDDGWKEPGTNIPEWF